MLYLPKGQTILIWGCGNAGTKIIADYGQDYKIHCLMDRKIRVGEKSEYMGYNLYNPEDALKELPVSSVVVIAMYQWEEAAKELEDRGLNLLESYIVLPQFEYTSIDISCLSILPKAMNITSYIKKLAKGKKIAATYGLCHMVRYKKVLEDSRQFSNEYIFLDLPTLNNIQSTSHRLLKKEELWKLCDVVLYSKNRFIEAYDVPNPKEILNFLKSDCNVISITSAAFKGYFPQHKTLDSDIVEIKDFITWGDKNIDKMMKEGKTENDISNTILSVDFYKKDRVEAFFENALMILQEDEKNCDIRIADYIRKNYKTVLLYYSSTHPTANVLVEIARRICQKLEIADVDFDKYYEDEFFRMDIHEELIYPSVYSVLNIDNNSRKINPGNYYKGKLSANEYIKEYVYLCQQSREKPVKKLQNVSPC